MMTAQQFYAHKLLNPESVWTNKYKIGSRPFVHTLLTSRRMAILHAALDVLGKPPAVGTPWGDMVVKVTGDPTWGGMLGNGPGAGNPPQEPGGVGNCVECDDLRCIIAWLALASGTIYKPTTADGIALYSDISGFDPSNPNSDQGTDPVYNAHYMTINGYQGHKYDGWAPVDPMNEWHVKWTLQSFGLIKWCWNLPDIAETQFDSGTGIWDYTGQKYSIVGGHDTLGVQYVRIPDPANPSGPWIEAYEIETWGQKILVTQRFKNQFASMAIGAMSLDFITKLGTAPSGLNISALHKRLAAVTN